MKHPEDLAKQRYAKIKALLLKRVQLGVAEVFTEWWEAQLAKFLFNFIPTNFSRIMCKQIKS